MHSPDLVAATLESQRRGENATEISRALGIPRRTISDWVSGRTPRRARSLRGCPTCGLAEHDFDRLPYEYVYLLGTYLGDGCLSAHPRGVFRLRIALDARYPGIISEVARAVEIVMPANAVGIVRRPYRCVDVSSYSKSWPCLFPQHAPGKKHLRRIELTPWQWALAETWPEALLRGLIHSDGCRFINTGRGWRHPRYVFTNVSTDIQDIFCLALQLLDIDWTLSGERNVYVSRKADVARMDEFIGPKA